MLRKFSPLVFLVLVWACGADSSDSTVVTPTDTLTSTATVQFNADGETLKVLKAGDDQQSDVFEICMLSMANVTGTLEYALKSQQTLNLNGTDFAYRRPLAVSKTKAGVNDRVFSVWGVDETVKNGVGVALELEVEPELLTFKMTCTG